MELIFIALIAAVLTAISPKNIAKYVALLGSVLALLWNINLLSSFTPDGKKRFAWSSDWLSTDIQFAVAIDGITMLMLLLTSVLVCIIIGSSFSRSWKNESTFYALILAMQSALFGVFMATDAIMFYIFWELALIPIYFICALWGEGETYKTTIRFFLFTFIGSLGMLASFLYLGSLQNSNHRFGYNELVNLNLAYNQSIWVGLGIFLAFAVKIPFLPLNAWQPSTYTLSPTPGSQLLSGIMLKMGLYGLIRWFFPLVPESIQFWQPICIALGVIAVIYGAFIAIRKTDLKTVTAYASLSHVGLIAASIATLTITGIQGALVQMVAHGINVVGVFYCIDIIQKRANSRDITQLGGIAKQAPYFAAGFLILVLGTMAVPFTNGFPGEFLMLKAVFVKSITWGIIAGLTIIFCAVYMLRIYQKSVLGTASNGVYLFPDLQKSEWLTMSVLVIAVLGLGIYPQWILNLTQASVIKVIQIIQNTVGVIA